MERQYIGRYRVIGRLGTGGMGTVFRAMDEVRGREVALKLPNNVDPETVAFLQQECAVLAQLEHHNIVQVFGSGSDSDPDLPFYIVMEYVDGLTVEQLLHQEGGHLEPRRALKIALGVAEALAYAHKPPLRIIHRDIKPGNILIRKSDGLVKVTDFGIAAVLSQRASRTAVGTLAYMAPEQATGLGVDERSDLYSLGAMLYEMLTGQRSPQLASAPPRPPGAWLDAASVSPEMRVRIDRLVLGLLQGDRDQRRPQRAAGVAEELRAMLEGRPTRPISDPVQRVTRAPVVTRAPMPEPRRTIPQPPTYTYYPPAQPAPYAQPAPAPLPPPPKAYVPLHPPPPTRPLAYQPPPVAVAPSGRTHLATASLLLGAAALLIAAFLLKSRHALAPIRALRWPPDLVFSLSGGAFPYNALNHIPVALLIACALAALLAIGFGRAARRRVLISGKRLRGSALAFFGRTLGYLSLLALILMLIAVR
jgi:serine/threonine protein kinase